MSVYSKGVQTNIFDEEVGEEAYDTRLSSLFLEHTPIEEYFIGSRRIFVKREDLFGIYPAPPLAKLRGARVVLSKLQRTGVTCVGSWDTRVSKLSQGIAAITSVLGMRSIVCYPKLKGESALPKAVEEARRVGAEIYPTRAGRMSISFSEGRRYVSSQGGVMLPFGLQCDDAVFGVQREAETVPDECYKNGTLVLSTGSGVTLAGILRGFRGLPSRIIAISAGRSVKMIRSFLLKYISSLPSELVLMEAEVPYSDEEERPAPFQSHPNYDRKVWWWLEENVGSLAGPILFWNIGG